MRTRIEVWVCVVIFGLLLGVAVYATFRAADALVNAPSGLQPFGSTPYERICPVNYQTDLEAAHAERDAILKRLGDRFNAMQLDAPSLTPFTSESSAPQLAEAIRRELEETSGEDVQPGWGTSALPEALSAAETPEGADYSDLTTPVCVISLAGLRRLDALFSELEQRREAESA